MILIKVHYGSSAPFYFKAVYGLWFIVIAAVCKLIGSSRLKNHKPETELIHIYSIFIHN